jgi:hypothetical protein
VNLGQQGPGIDVCPRTGRAPRWCAGLPVRREWIIQVPAPTEEPPLQVPEHWPEPEPVPVPEEAPV